MKASKQAGFVLVVGMMLLTVASGAVISGMSVNKYQERQAGNYVRTNNYEAGADEAFRRFERESWGEEIKAGVEGRLGDFEEGAIIFPLDGDDNWLPSDEREERARERNGEEEQDEDGGDEDIKYAFTRAGIKEVVKLEGDRVKVVFWGEKRLSGYDEKDASEDNNGRDVLQAVYSIGDGDEEVGGAYREVLLGCEGVNASGGGVIDSYDSRDGKYGENGNANKSNATIKSNYKGDRSQEGDIVLSSGQPVYGDVESVGQIEVGNSGAIHGDLKANEDIVLSNGAANVQGNVTSVQAVRLKGGSASITGNVEANQGIFMSGDDAHIYGNAAAPNMDPKDPGYSSSMMERISGSINSSPNVSEVATTTECGAFTPSGEATIDDLPDALDDASDHPSSGSLPQSWAEYTLTPDGLSGPNVKPDRYKVTPDVTVDGVFPEPTNLLVLDNFSLVGNLDVEGDMTIYVKGDVTISNGSTLSIAEGSSLKIVTEEGRFKLSSNLNVASDSPTDDDGNPILSLYSAYDDEGASGGKAGVNITADSAFKGTIFAPYSTVNVAAGGGLYGAVKGRRVEVSGGAGIHYDEALMESTIGTGGGGDGGGGSGDNGDDNSSASGWTLEGLSYGNAD